MASATIDSVPWVEKYRPTQFQDIVLSSMNRALFQNILDRNYFPNLLFYGPPGTGKTTTIINLINEYQAKYNQTNRGNLIHLNASDERGIDIIRNQIYQFVKSKNFFNPGLKFVILDEVDYMTKNAQQALKYLLQTSCYNVRFCLICNYISKIDESLKNEFICVRFNQLPKPDIYAFIKTIVDAEKLKISDEAIEMIQNNYHSDIRSMINFIQLNQMSDILTQKWGIHILTDSILDTIHTMLLSGEKNERDIIGYIHQTSIQYNVDKKNILKHYFHYFIRKHSYGVTRDFLNIVETITHSNVSNIEHVLIYFVSQMKGVFLEK
jgi:replication factor C subunit 3/5